MAQVQTAVGGGVINASKQMTVTISTANCTAGNTLILVSSDDFGDGTGTQIVSISDGSNTWSRVTGASNGNNCDGEIWQAFNIIGGIKPTVTVTYANGASAVTSSLVLAEYSGLITSDPKDTAASASSIGSSSAASGSTAVLSQASETIIAGCAWIHASATVSTPTTGYANLVQNKGGATTQNAAIADKTVAATTAQSATFAISSSSEWVAMCATFKNIVASTGAASHGMLLGMG